MVLEELNIANIEQVLDYLVLNFYNFDEVSKNFKILRNYEDFAKFKKLNYKVYINISPFSSNGSFNSIAIYGDFKFTLLELKTIFGNYRAHYSAYEDEFLFIFNDNNQKPYLLYIGLPRGGSNKKDDYGAYENLGFSLIKVRLKDTTPLAMEMKK